MQVEAFAPRTDDLSSGVLGLPDDQISNEMSPISVKSRSDLVR